MTIVGSTVVLTGATSGIGRATAIALAPTVGRLVLHGPESPPAAAPLLTEVRDRAAGGIQLDYLQADFGHLADVYGLADAILQLHDRVDVLINNAGVPGAPRRRLSDDGRELTLQVNYLAAVALTDTLAERVGRVVNVASATHLSATLQLDDLDLHRGYSPVAAYAQSKLALVTYTCWLAAHTAAGTTAAVSLHPGVIRTDLLQAMFSIAGEDPSRAASNVVATAGRGGDNGAYYDEQRRAAPNPIATDPAVQARLRELTTAWLR